MKLKLFLKTLPFLVLLSTTHAQIPVTDGASITTQIRNQAENISKWILQFNQMKQQIEQYKMQFDAMTGARGMGTLLDNPLVKSALPDDWENLAASIKSTAEYKTERAKNPVFSGMPKINEMFDVIASNNAVISSLYKKSNYRIKQIQNLMTRIDTASDPAAKQDLANRLINEQNAIQANENLVTLLKEKQRQQLEAASQQAAKEYTCNEFQSTGC